MIRHRPLRHAARHGPGRRLRVARAHAPRRDHLASLVVSTAGAAHDIAVPLATIAVVARDLECALSSGAYDHIDIEDIRLIRSEVERCRVVLQRIATDAGGAIEGAAASITAGALLDRLAEELAGRGRFVITVSPSTAAQQLHIPVRATLLALRNVVTNAWQAMEQGELVLVAAETQRDRITISISDSGTGMSPEVLARATEPLFTTKRAGNNLGLGLFLTRLALEHSGGSLSVSAVQGVGTAVVIGLPKVDQ